MRRPGPRGHKQKESFGSSSVQALLEVTSVVRGERDLKSALATIVLNLYRPEFDDFCVTDVYGNTAARDALLGSTYEWSSWRQLLVEDYRHGGAFLIPHGSFDWSEDEGTRYVPRFEPSDDPDAWHPEDGCWRSSPSASRAAAFVRATRSSRCCVRSPRMRRLPSRRRSSPRAPPATGPASSSCSKSRRR